MQEIDITKFIKKVFTNKDFASIFFTSLVRLLIMILFGDGVVCG
ncbi:MAG: hypothetical protein AAB902_00975 [Patescibacteria group bacterium]